MSYGNPESAHGNGRTSIKQEMPLGMYKKSVEAIRTKYTLPEGEDWLDQRETPVFPLVHAPKEFVKAYNKKEKVQVNTEVAKDLPNVVLLLWESFTTATKYVTDEV